MTSGLVDASFSLPKWQAVKMIFFAPCQMNSLTPYFPTVTNLNILLTISIHNQENKLHVRELIK